MVYDNAFFVNSGHEGTQGSCIYFFTGMKVERVYSEERSMDIGKLKKNWKG
jgi:hypothetical protein